MHSVCVIVVESNSVPKAKQKMGGLNNSAFKILRATTKLHATVFKINIIATNLVHDLHMLHINAALKQKCVFFFTFAPCMLLHSLYLEPNHALL
jgi:hypothetical protein